MPRMQRSPRIGTPRNCATRNHCCRENLASRIACAIAFLAGAGFAPVMTAECIGATRTTFFEHSTELGAGPDRFRIDIVHLFGSIWLGGIVLAIQRGSDSSGCEPSHVGNLGRYLAGAARHLNRSIGTYPF